MKPVDLDELEKLEAKATPGPWGADYDRTTDAEKHGEFDNGFTGKIEAPGHPDWSVVSEWSEAPDCRLIVALRNAAAPMIAELKELRQDVKTFQFDATLYRNRLADALAQADALRAEVEKLREREVAVGAQIKWEANRAVEFRAEVETLKAQLATAREALEEARHSIEHTYFCQNDSAETGCTCNALYAQNKIANALKKTTKGGGA